MVEAVSIWFAVELAEILHVHLAAFVASTTVMELPSFKTCLVRDILSTAADDVADSLPTPDGSMRMRSGLYMSETTCFSARPKSPDERAADAAGVHLGDLECRPPA